MFLCQMGQLMALDYGTKRTGIAVTDELQIIASGLTTVDTRQLFSFLTEYLKKQGVEKIIVGLPKGLDNNATDGTAPVLAFIEKFKKTFHNIPLETIDERFTSKMAFDTMIAGGLKKKARRNKAMIDQVSATIILQSYLEQQK